MIETAALLQRDTLFNVTLESDRHLATVRARVCHVRRTHLDDGYLVGLEFVGVEPSDMEWLVQHDASDHVPRA
jgi:c-di-GMP-binding flagellar brake protein YcgR